MAGALCPLRTEQAEVTNARIPMKGNAYEMGGGEHQSSSLRGWAMEASHHRAALSWGIQDLDHIFTAHGSQGIC